jgi:VanZ family protein
MTDIVIHVQNLSKCSRTAAVLLTFGLFAVGSIPSTGQAFHGSLHWVAHLAAYAMIAFSYCHGWPQRPAVQIAAFVAAVGAIHEVTEIITHSHGFETEDAIINAIGALIGVVIQKTIQRIITR